MTPKNIRLRWFGRGNIDDIETTMERTETPKLGLNGTVVRTAHWDQGKEDLERRE